MKQGKLTNSQLQEHIFNKLHNNRKETITGPGIGNDCAIMDLRSGYTVISTDPITGTEKGIGKLCVNICCNDVAAAGGEPLAILLTMLIPVDADLDMVDLVVDDVIETCEKLHIDLIGGHTEISSAVNRFVLSGVCIGSREPFDAIKIMPGDALVMSKTAGIEGSGIISAEKKSELINILDASEYQEAVDYLEQTSVVSEGMIGRKFSSLMHDATEGGVLGAAWEMANTCELGLTIESEKIPVSKITRKICHYYRIDPLRLISSGVMLFATSEPHQLIEALKRQNIHAVQIGEFTDGEVLIKTESGYQKLDPPDSDELYKVMK